MISIIIPAYNSEKTIRRCLDSIIFQTYTDWECLVIDDGSTDDTLAICNEYAAADTRFRVFHKQNGGVSTARNVGLDNARGQWITFCDSDDWVFPCWLTNYMENLSPEYDVIIQGLKIVKLSEDVQEQNRAFDYSGDTSTIIDYLYNFDILGFTVNKLFKTSLINNNKIRFNENLRLNEDGVFVIEYLSHTNQARSTSKIGYYYYFPDWDNKYKRYNDTGVYLALCSKSLAANNAVTFRFYINHCTNSIIDAYGKKLCNRNNLLRDYYAIVKDYNRRGRINYSANTRFNVFKILVRIDPSARITSRLLDFLIWIKQSIRKKH